MPAERESGRALGAWLRDAHSALRRVLGMPDYGAHLAHLRTCHPGRPVPTAREFYEEYLRTRYGGGPTRCC
jgi:uncharacterized short protein YbdD (DUF466 family)